MTILDLSRDYLERDKEVAIDGQNVPAGMRTRGYFNLPVVRHSRSVSGAHFGTLSAASIR
jgi:hypothetical protein